MSNKDTERNKPLTKKIFERLLIKAAKPLLKKSGSREIGTSAVHPPDDYSGKHKSRDKTEDERD